MEKVYLLQHCYEYEVMDGINKEESKIIGIYSSRTKAEQVIEKFKLKKGFNRFPIDCFCIDEYEINQDHWCDGFIIDSGIGEEKK